MSCLTTMLEKIDNTDSGPADILTHNFATPQGALPLSISLCNTTSFLVEVTAEPASNVLMTVTLLLSLRGI